MKKKIIIMLLSAVMAASAAACGDGAKGEGGTEETNEEERGSDSKDNGGEGAAASRQEYDVNEYVKLGDYKKLHIALANTYEVTKEQIDDYAQSMAEYYQQPVYKDTDKKKVEDGDTVNIDYVGKKDGTAFEGGTAEGYYLEIGSGSFIDGFEDGLIGKKVGETVELDLTFPEDYQSEELAGQAVVFTVKINKIVEKDESAEFELTDEFVKENFDYDSVDEYREKIQEFLEKTNESNQTTDTRQAAVDELLKICEVTIPDGLLDTRVAEYIELFTKQNVTGSADNGEEEAKKAADETPMTLELYLKENYNGMTEKDFRSEITTEMETNLKTELILDAVVQKEGIEFDEDAFKKYVEQQMSAGSYESEGDYYEANGLSKEDGEQYVRNVYIRNQALDLVIKNAEIEYGAEPEDDDDTDADKDSDKE